MTFSQKLTAPATKIETFGEADCDIVSAKYTVETNILYNGELIKKFVFPIMASKQTVRSSIAQTKPRPSAPAVQSESPSRELIRILHSHPSHLDDVISNGSPPSSTAPRPSAPAVESESPSRMLRRILHSQINFDKGTLGPSAGWGNWKKVQVGKTARWVSIPSFRSRASHVEDFIGPPPSYTAAISK
uniref:Uncharacterized protein n=1 Tax=Panagrolaimus davidi TaxID=227884 RepID=A0A914PIM8_9BILA